MKKLLLLFLIFSFFVLYFNVENLFAEGFDNEPPVELSNPIGTENPNIIIGRIINAILGVVGSLALLMFIYGGLTWMLAAGNNERVQKGKDILIWATIGMVVIFSSYAVIKFIFEGLGVSGT
ncbi:hypothetical protein C0583_06485 [Candidatus Parcubacteria bacterium]|nr:MAG: hypothetical protein C0583_06485 [Candidatus Parcubacteria bacterium]